MKSTKDTEDVLSVQRKFLDGPPGSPDGKHAWKQELLADITTLLHRSPPLPRKHRETLDLIGTLLIDGVS